MTKSSKTVGLVLAAAPRYSETFLINKIKALIASGFRVIVFTNKRSGNAYDFREVPGYRLPEAAAFRALAVLAVFILVAFRAPRRLYRFYKFERVDGIDTGTFVKRLFVSAHILPFKIDYLHFCFATLGVGKENLGRVLGARVSVSFRGYDVGLFPLSRPGVYERLWKNIDKVHTISDDLYNKAKALGLPDTVPCVKIRPAIAAELFVHERDYKGPGGLLSILTVARLQWKKGLEVAIDAMAILKARGLKFRYTIVGDGIEEDRLLFCRHQHGLEDEINFVGRKQHNEVIELMHKHDIYIQPSLQEGFCNSVLEAQASGLMCIVSDAEGLAENVIDNVTGWLVPRGDAESLANMIISVNALGCKDKERVGRAAIERIQREFSLEGQRRQFVKFFEE
jgi:colanic acid/amylovoran biosynthesis glycosyltransferase